MRVGGNAGLWQRFDLAEQSLCVRVNRGCRWPAVRGLFTVVSAMGDGSAWGLWILALACSGPAGAELAAQMAVAGIAGVAVYRPLKQRLVRERPYLSHPEISLGTAPLDRYSFPSGHTLHAVAFTILACAAIPALGAVMIPFTLLVAASRVVLGLHYPTDVAAGAAIGATLAGALLSAWPA